MALFGNGMATMYLMMRAAHLPPWLKLCLVDEEQRLDAAAYQQLASNARFLADSVAKVVLQKTLNF